MSDNHQFGAVDDDWASIPDDDTPWATAHLQEEATRTPPKLPENSVRLRQAEFDVKPETLRALALVTNVRPKAENLDQVRIGVEITGNQIRVTAATAWLACRAAGTLQGGKCIEGICTFSLPFYQLKALGKIFQKAFSCTVDVDKHVITIKDNENLNLNLTIEEFPDFAISTGLFELAEHGHSMDRHLVREALAFVSSVARIEKNHPEWEVVQIADGKCWGGDRQAMAVYEAEGLAGLDLRARIQSVRLLRSILLRFGHAKIAQIENKQIISDGGISCIIDMPPSGLPAVDRILNAPVHDRFHVDGHALIRAIYNLSVLQIEGAPRILVTIERATALGPKLKMSAKSPRGLGEASIETHEPDEGAAEIPESNLNVPLLALRRVIAALGPKETSPLLEFCILRGGKALMITERYEGICRRSLLAHVSGDAAPI